jgi:hypothetical protein
MKYPTFAAAAALAGALSVAAFGSAAPARATAYSGAPVSYVAAFSPMFGPSGVPFAGSMQLVIRHGLINGTYEGTSIRPDRLNNAFTQVTGTVDGGHVRFTVGTDLAFDGSLAKDGSMDGMATVRGTLYRFQARPGVAAMSPDSSGL